MANITITLRQASAFVERIEAWLADWRRLSREIQAQAELARKLRGVDAHLLRDMGLEWTGRRLERIQGDELR